MTDDPSMSPLLAGSTSFVVDPVFADTVAIDRHPVDIAQPTAGPNRSTTHVPTETTRLSLGALSSRWITDIGITGYTDSHIHFETKVTSKTVVSLGGPATTSAIKGYGDSAPVSTRGYSMVTAERAWHDSKLQHGLVSNQGDITLRTNAPAAARGGAPKRAVIQAEGGSVDLNGKREVNIAGGGVSIGARAGLPFEDVAYDQPWTGETPHSLGAKRGATGVALAGGLATVHNLVISAKKLIPKFKKGEIVKSVEGLLGAGEWLADLGELGLAINELVELMSKEESPEASIKIDAEKDVSGFGGGEAAFFGLRSASLGSALYTGVSAGVSASMKATLFAGVAATYASLKGYSKIEIGCDHGDVVFEAHHDVVIAADQSLIAVGKKIAQVSSEGDAYFSGANKTWAGTTSGGAWGLLFNADGVMLGKAKSANTMKTASIVANRSIKMQEGDDPGITLTSASTVMAHTKKGHATKSTEVKLHAKDGDVRIGGKKVLIDGP